MKYILAMLSVAALGLTAYAQSYASDDETVELSAFSVTSERDRGYTSPATNKPDIAITLTKPATAVVMEITLFNSNDKTDLRNREIYNTIKDIQAAVQKSEGLKFERREIQLRGEARRKSLFSRGGVTSYANVAVVAPLSAEADLFALVQRMRNVVTGVPATGATKIVDGAVGLVLDKPEQYRQELLKKIFEDLGFVKGGLGSEFEILPSGLAGPVRIRAASEKEVEIWIDYSFTIRSLVQLQHPSPVKG